jgi:hypothetical protein
MQFCAWCDQVMLVLWFWITLDVQVKMPVVDGLTQHKVVGVGKL